MGVERSKTPLATTLGVALALGVPLALVPTGILRNALSEIAPPQSLAYAGLREAFFWGLTALVLVVLTLGEKQPLGAIGLRRPTLATLLWGLAMLALIFVTQPLGGLLMRAAGGTVNSRAVINGIVSLPLWLVALTVLRAGVCEEVLFRGYGIDRLAALSGSRVLAAIVTALIFMLGHAEAYGAAYMLNILPVTTIVTVFYLWRRDLVSNIIAHFLTDAIGLTIFVLSPHH
jgi:membrane protease YdiL (CAAX protease family)